MKKNKLLTKIMIPTIAFMPAVSWFSSCGSTTIPTINIKRDDLIKINKMELINNTKKITIDYSINDVNGIRYCLDDVNSKVTLSFTNGKNESHNLTNYLENCSNLPDNKIICNFEQNNISNIDIVLKSIKLNDWCNRYCETYQSDYINNLTFAEHDYWKATCKNFHCSSMAEAVFTWAHNAGYEAWNTRLHEDRGTSGLDVEGGHIVKSMNTPEAWINGDVLYKDYRYLDQALKLSKTNCKINVFHGFEPNEYDLVEFINSTLGCDIEKQDVEEIKKVDLSKIKNKSYTNFGYCATSFGKRTALEWVSGSSYNTVPFLDLKVNSDVYGSYISYTGSYKHECKYGDNWTLAFPDELQFLINRNSVIKFNNCYFTTINNKNVLYIDATVESN